MVLTSENNSVVIDTINTENKFCVGKLLSPENLLALASAVSCACFKGRNKNVFPRSLKSLSIVNSLNKR